MQDFNTIVTASQETMTSAMLFARLGLSSTTTTSIDHIGLGLAFSAIAFLCVLGLFAKRA